MKQVRTFIYKRTHRSGSVSWMVRWKDSDTGIWKTATAGRTKEEAQIIEASFRQQLLQGLSPQVKPAKPHETISELIDEYYTSPRFLSLSEEWKKGVRGQMENTIRPHFGKFTMKDLPKDKVYKIYFQLKEGGISHTTLQKYHYKLSILGELYAEKRESADNPIRRFRDFDRLFPKQAPTRNIDFLSPDELERVYIELEKSSSPLILPFVKFLAHTGLRRSEAQQLKWADIDLESKFIHIRKSKTGKGRSIPLENPAFSALQLLPSQHHEYVFCTHDGTRYHRCSFLKPLQRAAKRAGIKKRIDIHTLRHSFGSNKIRMGWGLKKVSVILGHADIRTTSTIYTHLLDSDLKVQDEVRLNKDSEKVQTSETEPRDLKTVLSDLILSLKDVQTLNSESVANLLSDAFQKATDTSRNEKNPLGNFKKTSQNVTHMRRDQETHLTPHSNGSTVESDCSVISEASLEEIWSGRRGSNPRPRAWEARTLAN